MAAMTDAQPKDFDIIIAGGGLVGATLACLLAPLRLRVAVLDRAPFNPDAIAFNQPSLCFDPRVSAITRASQELFRQLEIWPTITASRSCAYTDMDVWDADGTGAIHFASTEVNQPELGHIIENSLILAALYERLGESGQTELISPCTITGLHRADEMHCIETEEGNEFRARLIVAADGGQSIIRKLAEFNTREWDYAHEALVTTVRTEKPHNNTALQRFINTGPLAFLPLREGSDSDAAQQGNQQHNQQGGNNNGTRQDNQHHCSIVWSMVPTLAQEVMQLSDTAFHKKLGFAIEHRLGKITWSDKRFCFPLRQCHATNYVQPGIALIGDAAHTIHPLAGQGVNLGLLDAKVLSEELSRALAANRSPGDLTVLRRYQRRRKTHNLSMMWLMEGFKYLFAEQPMPLRWLRNIGMSGTNKTPLIKQQLARHAMGLNKNPLF